jgi:hypothetical protein
MKRKILALGFFSLCCLAWFTSESNAFFGPLSPWHRHNRYVTQITCRPYNAFTPICWGNLVCDGCNPNPCGVASGCLPMTMGIPPWAYTYGMGHGIGSGYGGGCCSGDSCGASDMQQSAPAVRTQPQQTFTPPMPMPMPSGPGTTMYQQPMPQGVSQANYYPQPMYVPQYYPGYYPMYNPYMQQAPAYWYGQGR